MEINKKLGNLSHSSFESSFLRNLIETQRKLTAIPMSVEQVIEFLGFSGWPCNFDEKLYKKDIGIDGRAAKQIWDAVLQKSITASVKSENQLHFLILGLWCLQVLQEPEGTGRKLKLGDFLFRDSADQSAVESQEVSGISAGTRF